VTHVDSSFLTTRKCGRAGLPCHTPPTLRWSRMVLLQNTNLERFPMCFKKYSLICYVRQTNRYASHKLPDVHSTASNVALTLCGGQHQRHARCALKER
jgi:hypothetical protein